MKVETAAQMGVIMGEGVFCPNIMVTLEEGDNLASLQKVLALQGEEEGTVGPCLVGGQLPHGSFPIWIKKGDISVSLLIRGKNIGQVENLHRLLQA